MYRKQQPRNSAASQQRSQFDGIPEDKHGVVGKLHKKIEEMGFKFTYYDCYTALKDVNFSELEAEDYITSERYKPWKVDTKKKYGKHEEQREIHDKESDRKHGRSGQFVKKMTLVFREPEAEIEVDPEPAPEPEIVIDDPFVDMPAEPPGMADVKIVIEPPPIVPKPVQVAPKPVVVQKEEPVDIVIELPKEEPKEEIVIEVPKVEEKPAPVVLEKPISQPVIVVEQPPTQIAQPQFVQPQVVQPQVVTPQPVQQMPFQAPYGYPYTPYPYPPYGYPPQGYAPQQGYAQPMMYPGQFQGQPMPMPMPMQQGQPQQGMMYPMMYYPMMYPQQPVAKKE